MYTMNRSARLLPCVVAGVAGLLAAAPARAATITVNSLADNLAPFDGFCTLKEAVKAANADAVVDSTCGAGAGADTIEIAVAGTIVLNDPLDEISDDTVVRGLGVTQSVLDGAGGQRLLSVDGSGTSLTVERLTLRNGNDGFGGALWVGPGEVLVIQDAVVENCESSFGGAVFSEPESSVTIRRTTLRNNEAHVGGALHLEGTTLVIEDSTLTGNVATWGENGDGQGGALYGWNGTTFQIRRSTFTANSTDGDGGAIALWFQATGSLNSTTIASNTADSDADDSGDGGGIWLEFTSSVDLRNTVVAAGQDLSSVDVHPDFSLTPDGSSVSTTRYNFIGSNETVSVTFPLAASPTVSNGNADYVGDNANPLLPRLAKLAANGGPTDTRLPLPGSPLIDRGMCSIATGDQRGYGSAISPFRPVDDPAVTPPAGFAPDNCDIGAVERLAVP
jgi:parallel beta helix pectate lyase-like protein